MPTKTHGPDVGAAVAALLAAGHTPHDIERAVVAELRGQTRHWRRTEGGDWYEVHVCAACGEADYFHCAKGAPNEYGASVWCSSAGAGERKREEVTLREWEAAHEPAVAVTAAAAMPVPSPDLFSVAGVTV